MALSDRDIVITPNRGASSEPIIRFTGADALSSATISLRVVNSSTVSTLSFEGTTGQLFSLTDTFSGTIFAVNDVSGMPSIEVLDSGIVKTAEFSGYLQIGGPLNSENSTNTSTGELRVLGGAAIWKDIYIGGNATVAGNATISGTLTAGAISGTTTNATNISITDDPSNASVHYPVFVAGTSGNQSAKVDSSGFRWVPSTNRLGIGVGTPSYSLDVAGQASPLQTVAKFGSGGADILITHSDAIISHNASYNGSWTRTGAGTSGLINFQGGNFNFQTSPTNAAGGSAITDFGTRFYIANNGNVSIGTNSPTARLDIRGTGADGQEVLRVESSGNLGNTGYHWMSSLMAPNENNAHLIHLIGKAESGKNSGYFGFRYLGAGSNSNYVTLGGYGADNLLTIKMDGNVGIGTTDSQTKLHIFRATPASVAGVPSNTDLLLDSNTNSYLTFRQSADLGVYGGLQFVDNNVGAYIVFRNFASDNVIAGSDSLIYGTYQDHIFQAGTSGVVNAKPEVVRFKQNGNVGIGTNDPQARVHISGSAGTLLRLDGGAAGTGTRDILLTEFNTTAYGGLIRYDSAADLFTIGTLENSVVQNAINISRTVGNVGIKTTSPGRPLDVDGVANFRSHIAQTIDHSRPNVSWGASGTSTGAVIIYLPGTVSNYGMIHAVIDIYTYDGENASTIILGGHNWNSAWYNYGANRIGSFSKGVRVGVKNNQYCIILGTNTSTWSYGQVRVRKIQNGSYYTGIMDLSGSYTITQDSSAESYTWVSSNLIVTGSAGGGGWNSDNDGPGSGLDADFLDGIDSTGFVFNNSTTNGTINLNGGTANGTNDATLYVTATNNNDWGLIINKFNGSATEYGADIRVGSGATYALRIVGSGAETFRVNGAGSVYAPIYYDLNDSNYYADPASTSRLNIIRNTKIHDDGNTFVMRYGTTSGATRHINLADSTSDPSQVVATGGGTGISWGQRSDNNPYYMLHLVRENYGGDYTKLVLAWHTGIRIGASTTYGGTRFFNDSPFTGTEIFSVGKGDSHVRVVNNLYAPIMYDSNDTSYQVDPSGTTILNTLVVGGYQYNPTEDYWQSTTPFIYDAVNGTRWYWVRIGRLPTEGYCQVEIEAKTDANYSPFIQGIASFSAWNNSSVSVQFDLTTPESISSYVAVDNNSDFWIKCDATWNSYIRWRFVSNNGCTVWESANWQKTETTVPVTHIVLRPGQQVRTTRGNVTATSPSPSGTNNIGNLFVRATGTAGTDFRAPIFYDSDDTGYYLNPNNTGIAFRGRGEIYLGPNSSGRYTRLGGNGGATDEATVSASNGNLHLDAKSGNNLYLAWYNTSDVFVGGAIQATVYYDRNDTAYYADPASKSRFNSLSLSDDRPLTYPGILNLGNISYNYNFLNGSWSSSITAGIMAHCADQWEMAIHDSGSRVVSPFLFDGGSNHRLLMGRDIGWGTMYIEAASDFRAPVFYDSNDTNYRLDPAGTSILNAVTVNSINFSGSFSGNAGSADMLNSFDTRSTATTPESFSARIRADFKANSTNGLNDGGSFNGVMFWRKYASGSDWSGGGAVELAYTDNARLWLRYGTSTSWGAWKRVVFGDNFDNGGTITTSGDFRAPIFYDRDNTSFYADPASTSVFSQLRLTSNNAHFYSTTSEINFVRDGLGGSVTFNLQESGSNANSTNYGVLYLTRTNHTNGTDNGSVLYFRTKTSGGALIEYAGVGGQRAGSDGVGRLNFYVYNRNNVAYITSSGMFAPIYYDSNSTGYYGDFANSELALNVNGSVRTQANGSFVTEGGMLRITHPGGASFSTTTSTVTGAIRIKLPVLTADTMLRFTVKVFEYTSGESFDVVVAGYAYSSGIWTQCSAYIVGQPATDRNFTVRFGNDGATYCVWIGETASTWSYPQVAVTDFQAGYSSFAYGTWNNNWNISFQTAFNTVGVTITNTQINRYTSILYDANNTGYYLDPASTSVLNVLNVNTINATTINANISGSAVRIVFNDGPRNLSDRLPNSFTRTVNWDFVGAGTANGTGNYGGVMTFSPWTGTTASTGDSSYQLAFANASGVNASGQPKLSIRNGIDSTWNAWYTILHSGNVGSYALPIGGGTLTGSRPIEFSTSGGSIFINGDSGGWATGLYFRGSDNLIKAAFGSLGSGTGFSYLWAGVDYNNTWMTWSSSAVNAQVSLQQNGNQVLHAGNYTSYTNGIFLRAAGHPGYGDWNTFGNTQQTVNEIYQENFNLGTNTGSTNFPVSRSYSYGTLINFGANSSARAQVYISHAGNDLIFRGGWGTGSWQTWNKVLTDQNFTSYAMPTSSSASNSVDIRAPIFYDSDNTSYFWNPNTSSAHRLQTPSGYLDLGPMNTGFCHFQTDRATFYFNRNIDVDGQFRIYGDTNNRLFQGGMVLRGSSPTIYFRDTDQNSAMLHNNSNLFYILRGGNDSESWTQVGGQWPCYWNLTNNDMVAGRNISAVGEITAYASDRRLKENFRNINSALDKVLGLTGYIFDWNDKVEELNFNPRVKKDDIGFIAQEVEKVLPQAVTHAPFDREYVLDETGGATSDTKSKSGEDYLTVKYELITPLLVEAIKEQQIIIEELRKDIEELKSVNKFSIVEFVKNLFKKVLGK